jgi:hypothetical protein
VKAALAFLLAALPALGAEGDARGAFERRIEIGQPGKVVVELDRDVYERARPDLGDLRVLDDRGQQVPYLLDRAQDAVPDAVRQPRVLNRAFVRGESSSVTLDFGTPVLKAELVLSLSGDNFRRRVSVEGRNRHETAWETLTDGAYVFAVPAPAAARYETVTLPENNFQYLKVTVHNGPDDVRPVEIRDAWTRPQPRRRPREQERPLPLRIVADDKARETHLLVDLGARHQPFRALALDVADPQFFRGLKVEARSEPSGRPGELPHWRPLGETCVYRYERAGHLHQQLRVDVVGRERSLRIRILDRDDRPLGVRGLTLVTPVERLVFDSAPERRYRLTYGSEALDAPVYDIARTVGDPALWVAQAHAGELGEATRAAQPARSAPWTERHPALVWAVLGVLVVVLGGVTWRAIQ